VKRLLVNKDKEQVLNAVKEWADKEAAAAKEKDLHPCFSLKRVEVNSLAIPVRQYRQRILTHQDLHHQVLKVLVYQFLKNLNLFLKY
jgi:hypothetical protein